MKEKLPPPTDDNYVRPTTSPGAEEARLLRDEVHRLRAALQNISTTLEMASDDSLRAAARMARGMAATALSTPSPVPAVPRPTSGPGKPIPLTAVTPPRPKTADETDPGTPGFQDPTPAPVPADPTPRTMRRNTGDMPIIVKPSAEPARRITENALPPVPGPSKR